MYVYLIQNNINNKQYIGITNNYKKRWGNETSYPSDPKKRQIIQEAIHKYGKDNFTFKILHSGLSLEKAVELEKQYIQERQTMVPYGYNISLGGEYHPVGMPQLGEHNGRAKLTDAEAQYILDHRDQPLYVLYEEFSNKISYEQFKKIYYNRSFSHLTTSTIPYPNNLEFSSQFVSSPLDYDDIIELRQLYLQGIYWKELYQNKYYQYYDNEWSFWNVYNGVSFKLIMPEVFTPENKKIHASLARSGSRNGRAKLTENDVKIIRYKHEIEKLSNSEIYKLYPNLTPTSIRDVINYKTWKNIH